MTAPSAAPARPPGARRPELAPKSPKKEQRRGEGGFVVGPASTRPDGTYRIANDAPLAGTPHWLLSLIDKARPAKNGRGHPEAA